ncbi:hypothetical protein POV27_12255 [Aureisphaera galaxeae]|uniref:hypothetical protein n=1 Tax=Aureisphaera galaxeae TaxID=1538023 RepID=UPI0023505656|nr:hypothetical protein [Aureisphaera galaxeae]MDC8004827.1 hypothetical protein [Aureisphaera galaxeae]
MNKIRAEYHKTEYTNGPHLVMMIDGVQLNKIAETIDYHGHLKGLVSTLLNGWLYNKNEEEVVWERIDLRPNEIKIVPILMCPDDCDFSCTVVVVEMKLDGDTVKWNKLGIDETLTRADNPKTVGRNIKWFQNIGPFEFRKDDFYHCINTFKKEKIKIDQQ